MIAGTAAANLGRPSMSVRARHCPSRSTEATVLTQELFRHGGGPLWLKGGCIAGGVGGLPGPCVFAQLSFPGGVGLCEEVQQRSL